MLLLLLGCSSTTTLGGDDSGLPADSAATGDTADSADSAAPVDMDGDGYAVGADCMDLNEDVHPGATELWNGLDDDCDGVTDAEGDWSGTVTVNATAVYEGHPYSYTLHCPLTGTRAAGAFPYTVTCTTDATDAKEVLLLGETFTLTPKDPTVGDEATWSGRVVLTSSSGWDSDADGTVTWSDLDNATFSASLSAYSLTLSAAGSLQRR